MRVYIIASDGIMLCREAPATGNEGEIAVASNEELHAAPLSGTRLLALWNALPGVEKRRKVGDRESLIDQLWSAIEALPEPEPQSAMRRLASTLAGCRPLPVGGNRTSAHESRAGARSKPKSPACSIDRHRSCGMPGVNFSALDRRWASVAIC